MSSEAKPEFIDWSPLRFRFTSYLSCLAISTTWPVIGHWSDRLQWSVGANSNVDELVWVDLDGKWPWLLGTSFNRRLGDTGRRVAAVWEFAADATRRQNGGRWRRHGLASVQRRWLRLDRRRRTDSANTTIDICRSVYVMHGTAGARALSLTTWAQLHHLWRLPLHTSSISTNNKRQWWQWALLAHRQTRGPNQTVWPVS